MPRATEPTRIGGLNGEEQPPRKRSRPRAAAFAVICLVVLTATFGGGWVLANTFRSPAQQAAGAAAPSQGIITATVDQGSLEQTVGVTASVSRQAQQQIALQGASSPSIMTKQPLKVGDQISVGKVIAEINGRPVFAVPGAFPFYRDLSTGQSGPDVSQLQVELKAAGYRLDADGNFGSDTEIALRAMYKSAGYKIATAAPTSQAPAGGSATTPTSDQAVSSGSAGPAVATSVVVIPRTELIAFATLPAFVVSTPTLGTLLDTKSQIIAEEGEVVATTDVAADVAAQLEAGMTGILTGPDGQELVVTVASVGGGAPPTAGTGTAQDLAVPVDGSASPSASGQGGDTASNGQSAASTVVLASGGSPIPLTWLRSTALAVITVQIASKGSLIVPSIAVISDGNSSAHVLKKLANGSFTSVPVKETAKLSGRSAISPQESNELTMHDLVRVN